MILHTSLSTLPSSAAHWTLKPLLGGALYGILKAESGEKFFCGVCASSCHIFGKVVYEVAMEVLKNRLLPPQAQIASVLCSVVVLNTMGLLFAGLVAYFTNEKPTLRDWAALAVGPAIIVGISEGLAQGVLFSAKCFLTRVSDNKK